MKNSHYRFWLTACSLALSTLTATPGLANSTPEIEEDPNCRATQLEKTYREQAAQVRSDTWQTLTTEVWQPVGITCQTDTLLALGERLVQTGLYAEAIDLYQYLEYIHNHEAEGDHDATQPLKPAANHLGRQVSEPTVKITSLQSLPELQKQARNYWQNLQHQSFVYSLASLIQALDAAIAGGSDAAASMSASEPSPVPASTDEVVATIPTLTALPVSPESENTSPDEAAQSDITPTATTAPQHQDAKSDQADQLSSEQASIAQFLTLVPTPPDKASATSEATESPLPTASTAQKPTLHPRPKTLKNSEAPPLASHSTLMSLTTHETISPTADCSGDQAHLTPHLSVFKTCEPSMMAQSLTPQSSPGAAEAIREGQEYLAEEAFEAALEAFQEALDLLDNRPLSVEKVDALIGVATVSVGLDDAETARTNIDLARQFLDRLPDLETKADLLSRSAQVYLALEEPAISLAQLEESLDIYTELNNVDRQAAVLWSLANTLYFLERYDEAFARYEALPPLLVQQNRPIASAAAYVQLGSAYFDFGDFTQARQYYGQAVSRLRGLEENAERGLAIALLRLSDAELQLQNFDAARRHAEETLSLLAALSDESVDDSPFDVSALQRHAYSNISAAYLGLNRYEAAFDNLETSLSITREVRNLEADLGNWPEIVRIARGVVDLVSIFNPVSFGLLQTAQGLLTAADLYLTVIENTDTFVDLYADFTANQVRSPLAGAEDNLQQQLANAQAAGDKGDELSALLGLGRVYFELQRYEEARDRYNEAFTIAQQEGLQEAEAQALFGLGASHYYLGEIDNLEANANDLLSLATTTPAFQNSIFYEAGAFLNLARAAFARANYQATQEYAQNALSRWQALEGLGEEAATAPAQLNFRTLPQGDRSIPDGMANAHLLLANSYLSQSNYDQTFANAESALVLYRDLRDLSGEASALLLLSTTSEQLGQYPKAIRQATEALYISRNVGDLTSEASALNTIGNALYSQRLYTQAASSFGLARDIIETQGEIEELQVINQRGPIPRWAGRVETLAELVCNFIPCFGNRDLRRLSTFITAARSVVNISEGIASFAGLGNTYLVLGETDQALSLYEDTLTISQELGDTRRSVSALIGLSRIRWEKREYEAARDRAKDAINLAQEYGYRAELGYAKVALSQAYLRLAENDDSLFAEAFWAAQDALIIFEAIGDEEGKVQAYSSLGDVLAAQESTTTAIAFYKQAVATKENIEQGIPGTDFQISYSRKSLETYRQLIDLLISQERFLEAQYYLELLKVRELQEYTNDERWSDLIIEDTLLPEEQSITSGADYATLREFGAQFVACTANKTCADEEDIRDRLFIQYFAAVQDLESSSFREDLVKDPAALDPTAFANVAGRIINQQPGTVVIYPIVLEDRLVIMWSSQDGIGSRREIKVSRREIGEAVINFRNQIENRSDIEALQGTARQFYEWLIQPIEEELPLEEVQHLVFSLDRSLRYIPLAAIYDGNEYLIEQYTISTILSPGTTNVSERLSDQSDEIEILGLGVSEGSAQFNPLPFVDVELDKIIRERNTNGDTEGVFPGNVLRNEQVSYESLRDALADQRVLHIATHGSFQPGDRDGSFLLLGNEERLLIPEIAALTFYMKQIHLVVLSACQTALGGPDEDPDPNAEGLEIPGLAYYFIANDSPVDSVMASLWKVSDPTTSVLMQRFYRNLENGSLTKAEALQAAQLSMISSSEPLSSIIVRNVGQREAETNPATSLAHPYFWAPFILIGNSL